MEIEILLKNFEKKLSEYKSVIGLLVFIMLVTLSILTYQNFEKQDQIIETGGYVDGKIKCVCSQEAWDAFEGKDMKLAFDDIYLDNG